MKLDGLNPEEIDEVANNATEQARLKRLSNEKEKELGKITKPTNKSFLNTGYVLSEYEEIEHISKHYNINATDARKQLTYPNEYNIDGQTIPDLVRKMRVARRELKGEQKERMTKAIDNVIDAYTDHIMKCINTHYLNLI